jgi:two-component system, OmpR family, response regulator
MGIFHHLPFPRNHSHTHKKTNMTNTTLEGQKAKKVLIIEDEGDMCLLLNIMLTGKNMELDHVKKLASAEEYLQKEQPAVVILDNKLPDGFGIDFISHIKQNYPAIRIIMISGYDGSAKDVALENGADIFLEKPFTKNQLYEAIVDMMKEKV